MTNEAIIRKAVELAEGFAYWVEDEHHFIDVMDGATVLRTFYFNDQLILDALAAQLVRQVDAHHEVVIKQNITHICSALVDGGNSFAQQSGPDRTMNTLRAIVESKVLEGE